MRPTNRILSVLAGLCIVAYFLFLAGEGVFAYFSPDDLMNLYSAWTQPALAVIKGNILFFSGFYRPMGGVFYRALYAVAGFNPLPFRIACYFLLVLNLYLCYCLAKRLTRSTEIGLLATLIACYHAQLADIYYSTGVVYDLLCFTFFYGSFLYYVRIRQPGRALSIREGAVCCLLYIAALNSKEMAVTLPIFIVAYEWFYHRPVTFRLAAERIRIALIMTVLTILFIAGKIVGIDPMTVNPAYRPSISLRHYVDAFQDYAGKLLYKEEWFTPSIGLALLAALLLIAWLWKSPHLKLSWLIIALGILPVAFIPRRGAFVLYIPMFGWALFGATMLVALRKLVRIVVMAIGRLLLELWQALRVSASVRLDQVILFVVVAVVLGWVHRSHYDPAWLRRENKLQSSVERLRRLHPTLPKGAKLLFLNEPFETEGWKLRGLLQLAYGDRNLDVQILSKLSPEPDPFLFDYVFKYTDTSVVQLKPTRDPQHVVASEPSL
jgi:hypothetical protein